MNADRGRQGTSPRARTAASPAAAASPPSPNELHASAPANLLLMGEYAVLEKGGLGLACAPDVRATGSFTPGTSDGPGTRVAGVTPVGEVEWPGDDGVLGSVAARLASVLASPQGDIAVDTSAFFRPDGRKRGFGSSAAMTVIVTALWRRAAARDAPDASDGPLQATDELETLMQQAIDAHRAAQGGRGSGYDVAATTLGGFVRFRGGERPNARRIHLPWLPPFALVTGADAVATTGAVGRYRAWRNEHPEAARRFLARSNELVSGFVEAGSWEQGRPLLEQYRALTGDLGEAIGVSAYLDTQSVRPDDGGDEPPIVKALGAGNEIGVRIPASEEQVIIAEEGLRWE